MRMLAALAMLGAVLLVGCQAKHPTAPVSGLVTYKGKALARGRVVFFHESGNMWGHGDIGPDGRYRLEAPVGNCRVAITSHEESHPELIPKEKWGPGVFETKSLIPERYQDHMNNGLKFTVQNGENTADWKLQ